MKMSFDTVMDRPFVSDQHNISPGSYKIRFPGNELVEFDFFSSERYENAESPNIVSWLVYDLDESYSVCNGKPCSDIDILKLLQKYGSESVEVVEFFVYTGEPNEDQEINVVRVCNWSIEIDETNTYAFADIAIKE